MTSNYTSHRKEVEQALSQAVVRTIEGIGLFVLGEAMVRCPVKTGNLRSSINVEETPDAIDLDERDKVVTIGTPVEYAPFVELGTSKSAKQPFLRPAAENNLGRIKKLAAELLRL